MGGGGGESGRGRSEITCSDLVQRGWLSLLDSRR